MEISVITQFFTFIIFELSAFLKLMLFLLLMLFFCKKSNKEGLHCSNISIPVKDSYKILKRLLWFSKHNDKRSKEEDS